MHCHSVLRHSVNEWPAVANFITNYLNKVQRLLLLFLAPALALAGTMTDRTVT